jgi:hypothetical protein
MAMTHTSAPARIQIIAMAKDIEGNGLGAPQNPLTFSLWSVRSSAAHAPNRTVFGCKYNYIHREAGKTIKKD